MKTTLLLGSHVGILFSIRRFISQFCSRRRCKAQRFFQTIPGRKLSASTFGRYAIGRSSFRQLAGRSFSGSPKILDRTFAQNFGRAAQAGRLRKTFARREDRFRNSQASTNCVDLAGGKHPAVRARSARHITITSTTAFTCCLPNPLCPRKPTSPTASPA